MFYMISFHLIGNSIGDKNALAANQKNQLDARKNKDDVSISLLTTLIGDIENLAKTKNNEDINVLTIGVIKSYLDRNLEFQNTNPKDEVLEVLKIEQQILQRYMPKALTEDDIITIIKDCSLTSMPSVMKHFKENYFGQYDGKKLSELSKKLFSS